MRIQLNGEEHEVGGSLSVAGLIESFGFDRRKVAVERNFEIVPRSIYDQTLLAPGDRLEIVRFVGGW